MGVLDQYSVVHNYFYKKVEVEPYVPSENSAHIDLLSNAKRVTIAEISPAARGKITAHKLRDYRHKSFSLILLPEVNLLIDSITGPLGRIEDCAEFQ